MSKTHSLRFALSLSIPIVLATVNTASAQNTVTSTKVVTQQLATKVEFIKDLDEPQGLAFDVQGNILLADYGSGAILRFSRSGEAKGNHATNLKSPSLIVSYRGAHYVAERKNNRVIKIDSNGKVTPVGSSIPEPLGLTVSPDGTLFVVSHTTSVIYRFDGKDWREIYKAPIAKGESVRYGYRCLSFDNGSLLLSDEGSGQIFILTQGGRLAAWAKGFENPSGVHAGSDGTTYVTDESKSGGCLIRISKDGTQTTVADGLGRARDILFLDEKNLLVSSRDGVVWKLTLN